MDLIITYTLLIDTGSDWFTLGTSCKETSIQAVLCMMIIAMKATCIFGLVDE